MVHLTTGQPELVRVITYNVRYATQKPVAGEQPWHVRCPKLCAQLKFLTAGHTSAFICLQETLHSQLEDIQAHLGDSWARLGQGRDDGKLAGEFSPIFYRKTTWRCERSKTYWLSDTPEKPSRGWDAVLNRVVTVGEFRHQQSGATVVIMSTHFDHQGTVARKESAKLLLRIAKEWSRSGNGSRAVPVVLGGDFNSAPEEPAYKVMTAAGSGMIDLRHVLPKANRHGNEITYTSFGEPWETPRTIDFLFMTEESSATVQTFAVLANRFDDKVYLSDHRPIVADIEIPGSVDDKP